MEVGGFAGRASPLLFHALKSPAADVSQLVLPSALAFFFFSPFSQLLWQEAVYVFLPPNKYLRVWSFVKELSWFLTLAAVGVNDSETAKRRSWVLGRAALEGFLHALLGAGSSGNPSLGVFTRFNISVLGCSRLPCPIAHVRTAAEWQGGSLAAWRCLRAPAKSSLIPPQAEDMQETR